MHNEKAHAWFYWPCHNFAEEIRYRLAIFFFKLKLTDILTMMNVSSFAWFMIIGNKYTNGHVNVYNVRHHSFIFPFMFLCVESNTNWKYVRSNPLGQILGYHDKMALNSTKQNTDGSARYTLTTIKQTWT